MVRVMTVAAMAGAVVARDGMVCSVLPALSPSLRPPLG